MSNLSERSALVALLRRRAFDLFALLLALFAAAVVYAVIENSDYTQAIEQSRHEAILSNCQDQNARHDRTVAELVKLTDAAVRQSKSPAQRAQDRAGLSASILIVGQLAPYQNCQTLIRQSSPTH